MKTVPANRGRSKAKRRGLVCGVCGKPVALIVQRSRGALFGKRLVGGEPLTPHYRHVGPYACADGHAPLPVGEQPTIPGVE